MNVWKRSEAKYYVDEILVGSLDGTADTKILVSECEDNIDQEDDAVDDGEGTLGDASGFIVAGNRSMNLAWPAVIPVLQDQNSWGDEQSGSNHWEEKIWKIEKKLKLILMVKVLSHNSPILLLIGVFIIYPANKPMRMMEKPTNVPLMSKAWARSEPSFQLL